MTHICMLAAENDVIPGGKVGGIGDVVRDIPQALAAQGATVTVIVPAYGAFHRLPGAVMTGACTALFRGRTERIEIFELFADRDPGVRYLVLHHPQFAAGGAGRVYCDDDVSQPFATDANKFALFSVASLAAIKQGLIGGIDVLHLHDWHTGLATALIKFDPEYRDLIAVRCVFSIHNLALQGIRPFADNPSSLQAWYPHLHYAPAELADPRWPHCINPVATAIRLADKVHTVSPTYATEILKPNDPERGFHGGEGLEHDLQQAADNNRLVGIINGIDYDNGDAQTSGKKTETVVRKSGNSRRSWSRFMQEAGNELLRLIAAKSDLRSIDYLAHQRLIQWHNLTRPVHVVTSVGRLTDQKMALLLNSASDGRIPLEQLMESLEGRGLFVLLGSGDSQLEQQCLRIASRHPHLLFINQYSEYLSDLLFDNGDLFLMPSSFEPCGISQMLAMRASQPCLAHAVGGLRDTIKDDVDGFLFSGDSITEQSSALLARFNQVLTLREQKPDAYRKVAKRASTQRFEWRSSAARYLSELYS